MEKVGMHAYFRLALVASAAETHITWGSTVPLNILHFEYFAATGTSTPTLIMHLDSHTFATFWIKLTKKLAVF